MIPAMTRNKTERNVLKARNTMQPFAKSNHHDDDKVEAFKPSEKLAFNNQLKRPT